MMFLEKPMDPNDYEAIEKHKKAILKSVERGGVISIVVVVLDDYLRYFIFNEEKPHYNFL